MQALNQPINSTLSETDTRQAMASNVVLQHILGNKDRSLQHSALRVSVEQPNGEKAELMLPGVTLSLLSNILRELGNGKNVVVLATDAEVTTQQAADFLNVSRPYLVKLLEAGDIPFRRVGPRRRVLLADLLRYKDQEESKRHQGLDELADESQNLGMY